MATQILAIANTQADSADVVIAAGSTLTVALKDAGGPSTLAGSSVAIQLKGDNNEYFTVDRLTSVQPAVVIMGAGTYRFSRAADGPAVGVFSA